MDDERVDTVILLGCQMPSTQKTIRNNNNNNNNRLQAINTGGNPEKTLLGKAMCRWLGRQQPEMWYQKVYKITQWL